MFDAAWFGDDDDRRSKSANGFDDVDIVNISNFLKIVDYISLITKRCIVKVIGEFIFYANNCDSWSSEVKKPIL